jgi:hypothetical protein
MNNLASKKYDFISDEKALELANQLNTDINSNLMAGSRLNYNDSACDISDEDAYGIASQLTPEEQMERSLRESLLKMNPYAKDKDIAKSINQAIADRPSIKGTKSGTLTLNKKPSSKPDVLDNIEKIEQSTVIYSKEQADMIFEMLISGTLSENADKIIPDEVVSIEDIVSCNAANTTVKQKSRGTGYLGINGKKERRKMQ